MRRAEVLSAIHAAFADPACVRGGLRVEIHAGRKQAKEIFEPAGGEKWPRRLCGQLAYLVNADDFFKVVPAGSFKDGGPHAPPP